MFLFSIGVSYCFLFLLVLLVFFFFYFLSIRFFFFFINFAHGLQGFSNFSTVFVYLFLFSFASHRFLEFFNNSYSNYVFLLLPAFQKYYLQYSVIPLLNPCVFCWIHLRFFNDFSITLPFQKDYFHCPVISFVNSRVLLFTPTIHKCLIYMHICNCARFQPGINGLQCCSLVLLLVIVCSSLLIVISPSHCSYCIN